MKIALISPRGPLYKHRTGIWKKSLRYAPLTLTTLASLVPTELNAEVTIYDEGINDVPEDLQADIVGISAITGSSQRAYEISASLRKRGLKVVLGGVHATLVPDEVAQHADAAVVGYAEQTWPQLLRDFKAGNLKSRYYQSADLKLEGLPYPKRELLNPKEYTTVHTFEATRGCIHNCEFCVVPAAWGKPLQKPVSEVIADIRQSGARRLIFLDLNLIADSNYAIELFQELKKLRVRWFGLVTTLIAVQPRLLDLAAESGCKGVLIGFESLNDKSLIETQKKFNTNTDYSYVIKKLHEKKIAIMGCFVFGFDNDTLDTFEETVDFVQTNAIDLPRYAIMTPFPNTALFHRLKRENRLLTEDWKWYDGQHVVYQPQNMTPEQLLKKTEWAWKKTYQYNSIIRRLVDSRIQLGVSIAANVGYRFYANNLSRFYTCQEVRV